MQLHLAITWLLLLCIYVVKGDGNDWVSPLYVITRGESYSASTGSAAEKRIIGAAVWSAAKGPWSVVDQNIRAPSKDAKDYLSWAPYWFPDCNWCKSGTGTQSDGDDDGSDDTSDGDMSLGPIAPGTATIPLPGLGGVANAPKDTMTVPTLGKMPAPTRAASPPIALLPEDGKRLPTMTVALQQPAVLNAGQSFQRLSGAGKIDSLSNLNSTRIDDARSPEEFKESSFLAASAALTASSSNGTPAGPIPLVQIAARDHSDDARAAARGKVGEITPSRATADGCHTASQHLNARASKCTPSTTRVAPTATWTTCPYKQRDGKVNPDVKQLNNTKDIVSMAQSVLWNGVAYGLSNDSTDARRASTLIKRWFLDARTGVNPRVVYGQVIRGPDDQQGGYTGILDWRMIIKVVNAVIILRAKGSEGWDSVTASSMSGWANDYLSWLLTSADGKRASKVANNHVSFYYNQVIALYILLGDLKSAQNAANTFFTGAFMKQISDDGEQPYEAVRTRPFHYRCFNLEALITNAKLADNMGLNMWSARAESGATIQTAVDYTMTLDAGMTGEDVTELAPHVAAVAAAYGDPSGKYAKWLEDENNSGDPDMNQSWRFYNDPDAFYSSPYKGHTTSSQKFNS
ncbi:Chondroitin AC/alginate lyase [Ceraceosorus bombacis]|uniref:Chondroitin AC/alginate lyase n=1 Tax=Ceraceosorus bombacis TaxID=401625 RepID=A0A0P1BAD0_9BASI|nr:Chondroitin AC/alginate lyase [Ceraceosorus bombacis]